MYFKRTTQAAQRCKNEQQRCSYGRDWVGRRYEDLDRNSLCELGFQCMRSFCGVCILVKRRCFVCGRPGAPTCARRAKLPLMSRGGAAAATWICCRGDESRPRRGYFAETRRAPQVRRRLLLLPRLRNARPRDVRRPLRQGGGEAAGGRGGGFNDILAVLLRRAPPTRHQGISTSRCRRESTLRNMGRYIVP